MLHFFYGLENRQGSCNDHKKAAGAMPAASQMCIPYFLLTTLYSLLTTHHSPFTIHYSPLTSPSIPRRYLSSFLNWLNQLPLRKLFGFHTHPGMLDDRVLPFPAISKNRLPGE